MVRQVFDLAMKEYGHARIANTLNAQGIPAPRGGAWCKTGIARILANIAYTGVQASGAWQKKPGTKTFTLNLSNLRAIIVPNAHEAIIPQSVWDAIHGRPRNPTTATPRMLTGILKVNGDSVTGDDCHGRAFYRVRGKKGRPWLPVAEAEAVVWESLQRVLTDPAVIEACLTDQADRGHRQDVMARVALGEAQLGKLRGRRDRLVEMRLDQELTKEEFQRRDQELGEAVAAIEVSLDQLRGELATTDPDRVRKAVAAARIALAPARLLGPEEQRQLLRSVVHSIEAKAVRESRKQTKDSGGRYKGGQFAHWRLTDLAFRFGPAAGDGGSGQALSPCGEAPGAESRGGSLVTSS